MIEPGLYEFKKEFCAKLNIPMCQVERRLPDLLEWLKNFYDYKFYKGRPNRIEIIEEIGEYMPMPRRTPRQDELTQDKLTNYKNYTIASLGTEFKPNSRTKIARDAMKEFGYKKYGHTSVEAVARRYVKEPFDEYGESDNIKKWVYYSTYEIMEPEAVSDWLFMLELEKIGIERASSAFYRYAQGENIDEEIQYYQNAIRRFQLKYGDIPVQVKSWRLKRTEE
jgi:hypothetical protein